ncbi:MAG: energy-coupling factor ABC transporter ATP-binding protein [Coriobacteriia bacterium]
MSIISIDKLTFTYRGSAEPALRDIDLRIEPGDFVGIIGASGAGKSTLLSAINGLIPHYLRGDFYGAVTVGGLDTFDATLTAISHTVGTMFQDTESQFVATCVEDEVLYGLENFGVPREEIPGRVAEALDLLGISALRERDIEDLSGGQKQKVALASVIALRPQVLLLDEPTGELDPASTHQVFALLDRLNREYGITVVVVEQKLPVLARHARTLALLDRGRLRAIGPAEEVLREGDLLGELGLERSGVAEFSALLLEAGLADKIATSVDEAESQVRRALC